MRALVLNYTGTVGKTTIAANLLKPRIENAAVIAIESINESVSDLGVDAQKIPGEKFRELFKQLLLLDNVIIDVGASNIEEFLEGLAKYHDSHLEFDYFVVPVTNGTKEQKETISMLMTLKNFGVDPKKIRIIFNRVESDVEIEFEHLSKFLKKNQDIPYIPEAAIMENELFDLLAVRKQTIQEILSDQTDYRKLIRESPKDTDQKTVRMYVDAYTIRSLALTVQSNLEDVYVAAFGVGA